jgi:hypothetical protein
MAGFPFLGGRATSILAGAVEGGIAGAIRLGASARRAEWVTTNGVTVGGHHRQGCEVAAVCTAKKILQSDEEGPPFLNKILWCTALIGGYGSP